jgi:hypothetical protein
VVSPRVSAFQGATLEDLGKRSAAANQVNRHDGRSMLRHYKGMKDVLNAVKD